MDLVQIEEHKNNIVVKHQELVHNARYRLSELGIKVLSVLISMIKTSDTEFTQYAIQIKDFKELIHSDSKNTYKYAHKLISELLSNPIQIGDEQFNWASYGKYQRGDGVVVFEVHRLLKPYLLEMQKNFLQYNITNILPLKSAYVIRLYELCKDNFEEGTRYKKERQSVHFELKIERMRELFEIPKSYLYKDIRVNILDKAVKQFAEKTDLQISYKDQKIGRKVDRVIITVRENNQGSNDFMRSKQAFIAYMRENFVNQDILTTKDKYTNEEVRLSISPEKKLYNKINTKDFTAKRAGEAWATIYELAKEDKLLCLKQGLLFDENTPVLKTKTKDYSVKVEPILSVEELKLTDKFKNFALNTNLNSEEVDLEFLMFKNHHLSIETEQNRTWFRTWCGWINNANKNR